MGLKQSSRARLTRTTLHAFSGDTLFDALGRAVSRAECLPRKEFYEAWAVAKRVRRLVRGGPILELAAGHGLASWILMLLDASSGPAVVVDKRRPASAERLEAALVEAWPRLAGRLTYLEERVDPRMKVPPGALVISVHGCGRLTDKALDLALGARAPVAVLPCCQSPRLSETGQLEGWLEPRLAVDVMRAVRLQAAGYRAHVLTIPESITPQNRLLIGTPGA